MDDDCPDLPAVVPLRPAPIQFFVDTLHGVTAITRVWPPDASRRCKLCQSCRADHALSVCQVLTTKTVGPDEAALFDSRP